ncbi:MAG TPA: hypothetical protein VF677_14875 [Flavobacterium sp.]
MINDNASGNHSYFNPPEWIQGTFRQVAATGWGVGSRFTDNDFCIIMVNAIQCYKEQLQSFTNVGGITRVKETITGTRYAVAITLQSSTVHYKFRKISAITIEWVSGTGDFKLHKQ